MVDTSALRQGEVLTQHVPRILEPASSNQTQQMMQEEEDDDVENRVPSPLGGPRFGMQAVGAVEAGAGGWGLVRVGELPGLLGLHGVLRGPRLTAKPSSVSPSRRGTYRFHGRNVEIRANSVRDLLGDVDGSSTITGS
ncbi:hypothetical protein KFL_012580010 [Klebsormidium nitens]|uniref:Uncharacterized protein n=1 Tax=Klebsormidium nitens TaxID=105231 RepID=A0A1Y1IVV5_KLENI|nr:hypothetical protein KFL_012580010 [Klebsormidium nitens]|eukprot:GAQ93026.1 hypothetical protein KFL_012580010 [Klebsormidium nitens]